MTLFNIDKDSDNRLIPSVNAPDLHLNRMAHATSSISPRSEGKQSAAKIITKNSRIIANDGANNIGLFGFDDAGNMVVKVAKTGFDANSATNDNLIFNSAQDVFKITETGLIQSPAISIPNAGVGNYSTLQANSGVTLSGSYTTIPGVIGFVNVSSVLTLIPYSTFSGTGTGGRWYSVSLQVVLIPPTATLVCTVQGMTCGTTLTLNAGDFQIRYYMLQESAS